MRLLLLRASLSLDSLLLLRPRRALVLLSRPPALLFGLVVGAVARVCTLAVVVLVLGLVDFFIEVFGGEEQLSRGVEDLLVVLGDLFPDVLLRPHRVLPLLVIVRRRRLLGVDGTLVGWFLRREG